MKAQKEARKRELVVNQSLQKKGGAAQTPEQRQPCLQQGVINLMLSQQSRTGKATAKIRGG